MDAFKSALPPKKQPTAGMSGSGSFRKFNFHSFGPVFLFSQVYTEALPLHVL